MHIEIVLYICSIISNHTEQMYKEIGKTTIAKTRYSFKKGYMQVSIGDKDTIKKELMDILGITGRTYFSTILNAGITDISMTKYQAITQAFARRGITDVWTTEEA